MPQQQRDMLGSMHPHTLTSLGNLAHLLLAQGKPGEAEVFAREALAGLRSNLGDAHPDTLNMRQGMLRILTAQSKHREARELGASFKV